MLLKAFGHYASFLIPATIIGVIILGVLGFESSSGFSLLCYLSFIVVGFMADAHHERSLCLHCARSIPDNPEELAEAHASSLRAVHWAMIHPFRSAWFIVVGAISTSFLEEFSSLSDYGAGRMWDMTVTLPVALFLLALRRHSRLRPWCPYCRWEGGGSPERVCGPDGHSHTPG